MAYYDNYNPKKYGTLEVSQIDDKRADVFFVPSALTLEVAGFSSDSKHKHRTKILELSNGGKIVTIIPINTRKTGKCFLKPKYEKIKRITIEKTSEQFVSLSNDNLNEDDVFEILNELPIGLSKNYKFGLGFNMTYRHIVEAVEAISNCNEIYISHHETKNSLEDKIFYISEKDYDEVRRSINRINDHVYTALREVRYSSIYNTFADRIDIETIEPKIGKHHYREIFIKSGEGKRKLEAGAEQKLIDAVSNHASELVDKSPEGVVKLRGDLELVALADLIYRYEGMIEKKRTESDWQIFFNENPFIFSMAFNYPVILLGDQVSVGGKKFNKKGEKIADFMVRNKLTDNVALFEIKVPHVNMLSKRTISDGIYVPSSKMVGAVAQVLDQKQKLESNIAQLKYNSNVSNIETHAVRCCVLIGKIPENDDKRRSFEIYRKNLINVEVITYDEILENLKQLRKFLNSK